MSGSFVSDTYGAHTGSQREFQVQRAEQWKRVEDTRALARNKAESKEIKHTAVITGLDYWCERTEGLWREGVQRSLSKEETLSCCAPEG